MKKIFSAILVLTMLCSISVFAMDTSELEDASKQIEKALDGLKDLDKIDINNLPKTSGENTQNNASPESTITTDMMVDAGNNFTLGLKSNGTVVATGLSMSGATDVSDWNNITMIACGFDHSVGLKSDGTVVAIGTSGSGECNVEAWTGIKMIAAGLDHTIGLKTDGTVVATGSNEHDKIDVGTWNNIVAISAGSHFTVGLKNDGTVLAIGKDCSGILNVSGWRDIVAISASFDNILGLKRDGTVVNTMRSNTSLFKDVISIAASAGYAAGLKKDGTVITNSKNINTSAWTNIVAINAGTTHLVGLKCDGTVVSADINDSFNMGQCNVGAWQLNAYKDKIFTASPSNSKVLVNGADKAFEAYNIEGNNYFKLRDLAFVLNGTNKPFEISWNGSKNAINMLSAKQYTPVGSEMLQGDGIEKNATLNTSAIFIDGRIVMLKAYNINRNNYFKLRDVMQAFDVYVGWDGAKNTITIDTTQ